MLYFGLWLVMALLFAFTLEKMLMLTFKETGVRAGIYSVAAFAWFVWAVATLSALATQYPMPYIHTYVWMGPDYVLLINHLVAGLVVIIMATILGFVIK